LISKNIITDHIDAREERGRESGKTCWGGKRWRGREEGQERKEVERQGRGALEGRGGEAGKKGRRGKRRTGGKKTQRREQMERQRRAVVNLEKDVWSPDVLSLRILSLWTFCPG
jgi:hypothetical protein